MVRKLAGNKLSDVLDAAAEGLNLLRDGGELVTRTVKIAEPSRFNPRRVTRIRKQIGMSQAAFARLIGTTPATVRAWEQGLKVPSGIASRMLEIAEREPKALTRSFLEAM
ncbi:MAG: helix-turn-helix domain-containing protein [Planctomycetes bacterium]|nr:helix-turn-helix domain-containing protein [Planctomycetota bacterium]